jgi:flagellar protein FliJ
MRALKGLIRVHKWQLDERRQQLAQLERLDERLRNELAKLDEEAAREQAVAAGDAEAARAWAKYAEALRARRQTYETSLADVAAQLVLAREALAESFQEVKRYEIAAAARQKRDRAVVEQRLQIQQDEIALQIYRRRA